METTKYLKEINNKILGSLIKNERSKAELTQEVFAEKIGITPEYLSRIERGHQTPSLAVLFNISLVLNISVDFILNSAIETRKNENLIDYEINRLVINLTTPKKKFLLEFLKLYSRSEFN